MSNAKAPKEPVAEPEATSSAMPNPPAPPVVPEPAVEPPKQRHPLCVMADLFRTEAWRASSPVAASLLRLADAFEARAKEPL